MPVKGPPAAILSPLSQMDVRRPQALDFRKRRRKAEETMASRYHEVYADWKRDPEAFWAEAAEAIDWYRRWDRPARFGP